MYIFFFFLSEKFDDAKIADRIPARLSTLLKVLENRKTEQKQKT